MGNVTPKSKQALEQQTITTPKANQRTKKKKKDDFTRNKELEFPLCNIDPPKG